MAPQESISVPPSPSGRFPLRATGSPAQLLTSQRVFLVVIIELGIGRLNATGARVRILHAMGDACEPVQQKSALRELNVRTIFDSIRKEWSLRINSLDNSFLVLEGHANLLPIRVVA